MLVPFLAGILIAGIALTLITRNFMTRKCAAALADLHLGCERDRVEFQRSLAAAREETSGLNAETARLRDCLKAVTALLSDSAAVMQNVAGGAAPARLAGSYRQELEPFRNVFNAGIDEMLRQQKNWELSAERRSAVPEPLAAVPANGLSSEQAESLRRISGVLVEMESMTKQNLANSKEARSLAEQARGTTERGSQRMEKLSEAIMKIKGSAGDTSRVVKTIDEIAFQTNLLALNAAVEAARAGDAGKGFAVVAEEVRNLAMRSAEAAKNTAALIQESVRNVEDGVAINRQVAAELTEINNQIHSVSEVMSEVAVASEQQNQSVQQMTLAIDQMNGPAPKRRIAATERPRRMVTRPENLIPFDDSETVLRAF